MADRNSTKCSRLGLCVLALFAMACSPVISGSIKPPVPKAGSGSFWAGAGVADLTPIPGIPMAGYAMSGKIARGVWVRLKARALYLEDENGKALVMVACDLDQIPNGLSDRVAELLRATVVDHVGRPQIILGASHTHHGPGAYFSSGMYNSFTTARQGFDKELFEFLAGRIVEAITNAYGNRQEAVLRTPDAAGSPNGRLPCAFRNRSREAFERNPKLLVDDLRGDNPFPSVNPCPERCPDKDDCTSVHTLIDYFTVVEKSMPSRVIGVAVFLAAHATVLSTDNELYTPDFFGVTSTLLETGHVACPDLATSPDVVVAVFNGAEGDVSPAWIPGRRDRKDVLGVAELVANKVCDILPDADNASSDDIAFQWDEIDPLTDQEVDDPFDRRSSWTQRTSREPLVGAPATGGAEDGRTILHEMGFVEGMRGPVRNEHGAKNPFEVEVMGFRTTVANVINQPPPKKAPIGVYRLGTLALVTLPGEFTTMLGERIREIVGTQVYSLVPPPERVLLIGLAGGHVSYVTTPQEYEGQHYEGAQNLYGAATGGLMARKMEALAASLGGPSTVLPVRDFEYDPGKEGHWRARDAAGPAYEVDDGLERVVQDHGTLLPKSDFPTFCFRDGVPRLSEIGAACHRALPDVYIETGLNVEVEVDGMPQSNPPGLDVVTVLTGVGSDTTGKDLTEWCAIWMIPKTTPLDDYQFHVDKISGGTQTSGTFTASGASVPPFFEGPTDSLVPDRRDSVLCDSPLDIFNLCPEPQTCLTP